MTAKNNQTKTEMIMIAEVEATGKSTFVHGSNRRHAAACKLIETGEYCEVKVGYNLYRLRKLTDVKIEKLIEAGILSR